MSTHGTYTISPALQLVRRRKAAMLNLFTESFIDVVVLLCRRDFRRRPYKGDIHFILIYESNQDKKSKNLDDFFLLQNRLEILIWVIERFPKNILFFFSVKFLF